VIADHKNTTPEISIRSRVLAVDLGTKRIGLAISDAMAISIKRLEALPRTNWKQLVRDLANVVQQFDAQTVVIGLPLRLDGSQGDAAVEVHRMAENLARSLTVPVYLQDERLTSAEAEQDLRQAGHSQDRISSLVDSEAAAIILRDFLAADSSRLRLSNS
jgi:putative holliday junction resolvase